VSEPSAVIFQSAFYLLGGRTRVFYVCSIIFASLTERATAKIAPCEWKTQMKLLPGCSLTIRSNGTYFGRVNHFNGSKAVISPQGNIQFSEQ
jgi:hypothetical protein